MPTNYTAIANGAAANAATFNAPLTQLDTALVNLMTVSATISATWNVTGAIGFGTASPLAPIHVGAGTTEASTDSQILISHLVDDSGGLSGVNGHAFSDSSLITRTGTVAYNSYDARITIGSTASYAHYAAFQSGPTLSTSGTISILYDFVAIPAQTTGTVTNRYAYYVGDMNKTGGTFTNQYGLYVAALTAAGTLNYAVYTAGSTISYFGGNVTVGGVGTSPTLTVGNQTSSSTSSSVVIQGRSSGGTAINATHNLTVGALYELNTQSISAVWSVNTVTGDITYAGHQNVASGKTYKVNSVQVVGARNTGWTAMTGTANKATAYDTATVTTAQLAGRVMAIQAALTTHGLLGA